MLTYIYCPHTHLQLSLIVTLLLHHLHQEEQSLPSSESACTSLRSLGKSKLDNNKGSQSSSWLPISYVCTCTELYIGHPLGQKSCLSSRRRGRLSTPLIKVVEEGNSSLHCVNDIVHSLQIKQVITMLCSTSTDLMSEIHEGERKILPGVSLWLSWVKEVS